MKPTYLHQGNEMRAKTISIFVLSVLLGITPSSKAKVGQEYDIRVDLKNVSGQIKENWPVVLRVYTVLGRNLSAGSIKHLHMRNRKILRL